MMSNIASPGPITFGSPLCPDAPIKRIKEIKQTAKTAQSSKTAGQKVCIELPMKRKREDDDEYDDNVTYYDSATASITSREYFDNCFQFDQKSNIVNTYDACNTYASLPTSLVKRKIDFDMYT